MANLFKPNLLLHSIGLLALGILVGILSTSFGGASAGSYDPASINSGDTAWMLVSSALVMLMIPAVGFFYAGMVRSKNVVSVLKHSLVILSLVTLQWVLIGYTLVFGKDVNGLIGDLSYFGLRDVGFAPNADYAATIPHLAFMVFQGMFAIITPALIIGSFVERIKFKALVIFTLLWATLVYDPIAHWVWGVGGFLRTQGALDFAGGTVVHISAGFSAIAAAWLVGRREDYKTAHPATTANNVPFVILGAALLWFGWFGFNAGSALTSGALAASAFVVTNIAAAAAALTWMTLSWSQNKKPSAMGTVTGAVCGLVAITPASGFVGPMAAIAIGIISGVVTYLALYFRSKKMAIDDTLD
ncbi:MAG: ammonium transporter, partial [Candidatus Magasanikbacteria bacterium]|nr:ammonium transporter [Candidatus Magasanikbacteria bacterium]